MGDPLILTLALDAEAQGFFDALRRGHFPPERNYLDAHLTLFHKLPADSFGQVEADVREVCAGQGPLRMAASGVLFLGRGVAYALDAPALLALRRELARRWGPLLGAQDRQRLRPHVTIQNKVSPERARALYDELRAAFVPFPVVGEGLLLWRYRGGPWEPVGRYPFAPDPPDTPGSDGALIVPHS